MVLGLNVASERRVTLRLTSGCDCAIRVGATGDGRSFTSGSARRLVFAALSNVGCCKSCRRSCFSGGGRDVSGRRFIATLGGGEDGGGSSCCCGLAIPNNAGCARGRVTAPTVDPDVGNRTRFTASGNVK